MPRQAYVGRADRHRWRLLPTPWQVRFWNYAIRDGMRVPIEGEVAWMLPEGARPYWRGQITTVTYEFSE
jgi:hypothetical protein